jgi:hypothetical protein
VPLRSLRAPLGVLGLFLLALPFFPAFRPSAVRARLTVASGAASGDEFHRFLEAVRVRTDARDTVALFGPEDDASLAAAAEALAPRRVVGRAGSENVRVIAVYRRGRVENPPVGA